MKKWRLLSTTKGLDLDFFIAVGLMLSPRAFIAAGNAAGFLGSWFFALLAGLLVWGLTCWRCQRTLVTAYPDLPGPAAESRALRLVLGPLAPWLMPVSRLFLFTVLATSILALSGFAFNEVFVYQFPNMGFTFVLLILACGAHVFTDLVPRILQTVCATGAILGFGIIGLVGVLSGAGGETGAPALANVAAPDLCAALAPAAVVFMGFELADSSRLGPLRSRLPWGLIALIAMLCCFGIFARAAQVHVPLEKLARISVPHMTAGRRILGDPGRYLVGGAVILGSVAAVNALLLAWRAWISQYLVRHSADSRFVASAGRSLFTAIVPFAAVAVLLAGGWAGKPNLERWIASATTLYFVAYAALGMAAARLPSRPGSALPAIVLSLVLAAATVCRALPGVG